MTGRTDLPDGASLIASVNLANQKDDDIYLGVQERVTVDSQSFMAKFLIPNNEALRKGPHSIEVSFSPNYGQPESVLEQVGKLGENLANGEKREGLSWKNWKTAEVRTLPLSSSAQVFTFQSPEEFVANSPEYAVAHFVRSWKNRDWIEMAKYTQRTAGSSESDVIEDLANQYDFKDIKGFSVLSTTKLSDMSADVAFNVEYQISPLETIEKRITARVIKEDDFMNPSSQGVWKVNPISVQYSYTITLNRG